MATQFITESWLREHHGLANGTELHLHLGDRLTPSAQQLLAERRIKVHLTDDQGRAFIDTAQAESPRTQVHPLTGSNIRPNNQCSVCGSQVQDKPSLLTHLDDQTLVLKNHPRIALRGRLDTLIAHCVALQHQLPALDDVPSVAGYMADLRSFMGNVLRSEVTGEQLGDIAMGDMDAQTLHQLSHNPLKYLSHDHIVPSVEHGLDVALLNRLRAEVRETELLAVAVYLNDDTQLDRTDIVAGLNRLSSAIYVLMLLILVAHKQAQQLPEPQSP